MAGVSQFSQGALSVKGRFIHIEEVAATWLEAGGLVTLDSFVNGQVAARLDGIPLDDRIILIGPAERADGAEGQLPGLRSAQDCKCPLWPLARMHDNCPYRARELTGNSRLGDPRNNANDRHVNYYKRKRHLNAMDIGEGLEAVGELPELLAPLTDLDFGDIKS